MIKYMLIAVLGITALPCLAQTPPELAGNDQYATGWFGVSASEPIETGYIIADGKYIDAPYTVEQRGYVIMVNGVQVNEGSRPQDVFPGEEYVPVPEDPGIPEDITERSTIVDLALHPVSTQKQRHWQTIGMSMDEFAERVVDYYQSMPCVAAVEETTTHPSIARLYKVTDVHGNDYNLRFGSEKPYTIPVPPTKQELYPGIMKSRERMEQRLRKNAMLVIKNGGLLANFSRITKEAATRWNAIFGIIESDIPIEAKVNACKKLGVASEMDTELALSMFDSLFTDFQASPQLQQRLGGDEAWKASAKVYKVEKQFPPFWEQAVAIEPEVSAVEEIAENPETEAPTALLTKPKPTVDAAEEIEEEPETLSVSPRWPLIIGVAGLAVLILLIVYARRKKP